MQPNQIDDNIIWDVRNAEPGTPGQRGCAGSGIFINASDHLIIAQNLIGRCDNSGIFAIVRPDREAAGTAADNKIYNNIFASCGKSAIVFLNQNNKADGNVYRPCRKISSDFSTHDEEQWLDLSAWRDEHGWDKHGATADLQIEFDPELLQLTLNGSQLLPKVSAFNNIETDIFGRPTGGSTFPGPLGDPGAKSVWKVDPRSTLT